MKQIIKKSKKGNNLEIHLYIPFKKPRYNPYMEEQEGEMDSVVGVIDERMSECGFAFTIDMSYKEKGDQFTSNFYEYQGNQDEFVKLCKKLDILLYAKTSKI